MSNESEFLSVSDIRSDEFSRMQAQAYNNDILRLHKRLDEFVDTLCPACGSDLSSYKFEKYKCKFVECSECETLYMSPRPTPEIMNDYYSNSENYSIWSKYIFPKSESNRRDKICQPNLMKIIDVCDKFGLVDPEILEIGPGFGTFSELAKDSGFFRKVKVIERTPEMVEACRNRGLEVIDGVLENIVEKKIADKVDVVVCFEVVEHVFSPADFMCGISKVLNVGGLFVLTCPNGKGFDTVMLREKSPAVDTEHVNLFNPESLSILLNRSGFEVLEIETPGRLDVDIFKRAVLEGDVDVLNDPFLELLTRDDSTDMANDFQRFLIKHNLSGNMRVVARKIK